MENNALNANVNINLVAENKGVQSVKQATDDAVKDAAATAQRTMVMANRVATGALIGIGAITVEFMKAAVASMAFESSFAGIRKTVEATEEQFAKLSEQIKNLSTVTPVSTDDLNRIGELGGQLGVAVENLPSFIKTVAELGVTTNLTFENAALGLARLDAIAQLSGENFSNIAATIVELGNNFAATESEIMTTVLRIQQAAIQVGATTADALAFATALQAIGVPAQAGGTAVARVFQSINQAVIQGGENLETFGKIAEATGRTTQEGFAEYFRADPAKAVDAFIVGLGRLNDSGQDVITMLDDLGLSQRRTMLAILGLAETNGLSTEALELGNKAYEENTAAVEEALKRYATLESQVQMTKNAFNELQVQIGDNLTPTLKQFNILIQEIILGLTSSEKAFKLLAGSGTLFGISLVAVASKLKVVRTAMSFLFGSKIKAGIAIVTTLMAAFGLKAAQSAGEVERLNNALDVFSGGGEVNAAGVRAMITANDELQDALAEEGAKAFIDPQKFELELANALASGQGKYNKFLIDLANDTKFFNQANTVTDFLAGKISEDGIIEGFDNAQITVEEYINKALEGYDNDFVDRSFFTRFLQMSPADRANLIENRQELANFYNSVQGPIEKMTNTINQYNAAKEQELRLQAMEALGITEVLFPAQETMIRQTMERIKTQGDLGSAWEATLDDIANAENIFDRIQSNVIQGAESLFNELSGVGELAATSAEEINQNLAEKIRLSQIFEQQIEYLKREGFDDVALEFSKLGPEYAGVLQNLLDNTDQLNLREILLEKLGLSESEELKDALFNSAGEISESVMPKTQELGSNYIKGVIKGMQDTYPALTQTVEGVFKGAIQTAYMVTDSHSPSRKTAELGKFLMLGFVKGINDTYPTLEKSWKGKTIDLLDLIEKSVDEATSAMTKAFGSQFGLFNSQQSYLDGEERINELIKERTELLKGNTAQQTKNLDDARDKAEWAKIAYEEGVITLAEYQLAQQELEEAENARANRLAEINKEIERQQLSQAQNLFSLGMDAFKLLQMGPEAFDMFKDLAEVLGIDASVVEKITGKTKELADTLGSKFGNKVDEVAQKFFDTNLKIEQEEIEINMANESALYSVAQVDAAYTSFANKVSKGVDIKVNSDGSFNIGGKTGYAKGGRIPMYAEGGYLNSGYGIVGEAGPELIRAIPGGGVDITPIGNVGHTGITVNNLNVNVTGVPADPGQARKAAIEIRKALSRLDREGLIGTGIRGR